MSFIQKRTIEVIRKMNLAGISMKINSNDKNLNDPNSGIAKLMHELEKIIKFIPKKNPVPIRYCVYSNCELKWFGIKGIDIECFIGIETSQPAALDKKIKQMQIIDQTFIKFLSIKGAMSDILPKMREEIMGLSPEELGGRMTVDYQIEIYDPTKIKIDSLSKNSENLIGQSEFWSTIVVKS